MPQKPYSILCTAIYIMVGETKASTQKFCLGFVIIDFLLVSGQTIFWILIRFFSAPHFISVDFISFQINWQMLCNSSPIFSMNGRWNINGIGYFFMSIVEKSPDNLLTSILKVSTKMMLIMIARICTQQLCLETVKQKYLISMCMLRWRRRRRASCSTSFSA